MGTLYDSFNSRRGGTTGSQTGGSLFDQFSSRRAGLQQQPISQPKQQAVTPKAVNGEAREEPDDFFARARKRISETFIDVKEAVTRPGKFETAREIVSRDINLLKREQIPGAKENVTNVFEFIKQSAREFGQEAKISSKVTDDLLKSQYKGTYALFTRMSADMYQQDSTMGKIMSIPSLTFILPKGYRTKVGNDLDNKAQALQDSAFRDIEIVEEHLQGNPLDVETMNAPFMEKIQDPAWVARGLTLNLPSFISSLGITTVVTLATKNPVLGLTAGFGGAFAIEGGSSYNDALQAGVDEPDARSVALVVGSINGILEIVFPGKKLVDIMGGKQIKKEFFKNLTKLVIADMSVEGITESIQEVVANAGRMTYDETANLTDNIREAGFFGAIMGGGASTASFITSGGKVEPEVPAEVVAPGEAVAPADKVALFRGGGEGAMPKGLTAQDIITYETEELGNKIAVEEGIKPVEIPSEKTIWVTDTEKSARRYGEVEEVPVDNFRVIARDDEGGMLIEKLAKAPAVAEPVKPTEIKTTKLSALGGMEVEIPVARAIEITATAEDSVSSGFHGAWSEEFNGLTPMWGIVYRGKPSKKLISAIEKSGLKHQVVNRPKGSEQFLTEVYLPNVGIDESDKAREVFDKFADTYEGVEPKVPAKVKPKAPVEKKPVVEQKPVDREQDIADYVDAKKSIKLRKKNDIRYNLITTTEDRENITSRFLEHPAIKDLTTTNYQYLFDFSNSKSLGLKAPEKKAVQRILKAHFAPDLFRKGKVDMAEFRELLLGELMDLDVIVTDTYSTYGADNVGLSNADTKTYILNSPFEHGLTGHFSSDFGRTIPRDEVEVKEIPVQPQNPRAKFAVIKKDVELTEQNIESNVFHLAITEEEANEWIENHTETGVPTYTEVGSGEKERPVQPLLIPNKKGLFSHFRTFDNRDVKNQFTPSGELQEQYEGKDISHIAEVQSDAFQRDAVETRREKFIQEFKTKEELMKAIEDEVEIFQVFDDGSESVVDNTDLVEGEYDRGSKFGKSIPSKDTALETQFQTYRNIWHERSIREAINIKAKEGFEFIRFPTPRTVALIEGFVSGEGDEDVLPYEVLEANDTDQLEPGDTIDYGGEEMTVVEVEDGITVASSDKVNTFRYSEYVDEDIDARLEDVRYNFEKELEKDFGKINTPEKAQDAIDQNAILVGYGTYLAKAEDKKNAKQWFKNNEERKTVSDQLKGFEEDLENYNKFLKLLENDVMKKEKITRTKIDDHDFKDKLNDKYGLDHGYWNYILNAYEYEGIDAPVTMFKAKKKTIENIKEIMEGKENGIKDATDNLAESQKVHEADLKLIGDRTKPPATELKTVPKKLLKQAEERKNWYGFDYEVEQLLDRMADEDYGDTFTFDDAEDSIRQRMAESYEADFEGMFGEGKVFYDGDNTDPQVYTLQEDTHTETLMQPDEYEEASSVEDFDIGNFQGTRFTILNFYEKRINRYLQKIRKGNIELITDENENEWYETRVTKEDLKPPTAYRLKDDLSGVGIKITDEQEQEIIKLNKKIFGDTNVKITGQILANDEALGSYEKQIIKILDKQVKPEDTFYHEAVHRYLDIFTDRAEYIAILKEGQERYNTNDLAEVEERLAEDFISYVNDGRSVGGKLGQLFKRYLNRLKAYFKNQDKVEALYSDIITGKAKKKKKFRAKAVPRGQLPAKVKGEPRVSRLEARVKNVIGTATPENVDELGTVKYNQLNKEENIKKAVAFVNKDSEKALEVLSGREEPPKGVLVNSVYVAMEQLAKGDIELARRLASLRSTRLGQEISILSELDPDSSVRYMKDIIRVREAVFDRRYKKRSKEEIRKVTVDKIEKQIKPPNKTAWNSFLEEIKC